ncbi:MAG: AI-2E family transporter [bacterium]|nr:AI-2E family transporter [bacterium]
MNNNDKKLQMYFFAVLFLGVLFLAVFVFLPFFIPLSVAAALAILCRPFYERVVRLTYGREGLSAFLTVVAMVLILLAPLTLIGMMVFQEARELSLQISPSGGTLGTFGLPAFIEEQAARFFPEFSLNFNAYARQVVNWLVQNLGMIFAGIVQVLLSLFLGLMAFYYFLKDGRKLIHAVMALSPLPDEHDREILTKLTNAINSVIRGSLVVAAIQGILSGVGLAIFGVPNPALFGSIAAVAALIPGIGTSLVLLPAIAYLFIAGSIAPAVGLLVWAVVIVGLVDNILGPKLMGQGIPVHPFLILLSVIGGLGFFGPIGFLLGPLVISLLFALIEIYRLYNAKKTF